ncbi:unnamed protein product [Triticum turgidum subsp. durum]|uniref:WD repeat-containing protein 44 n=1 Tax=Triticum turgidum subsp. durum TaxID=4567 RepID=A0A9R1RQG0_TRITD|nr:unnamed protein product [Triticum turgidum subsp. durum]
MSGGEEEEDEDEEVFYESRDRVLSSSGSSTSASDDDDHALQQRRRRDAYAHPAAAATAALDLWTSQPAPVQERRRRLLQMMGLAGDPSLARLEMGRSVSYDGPVRPPTLSPMPRSRSDGAVPASTPVHRSSSDSSNGAARPRRRFSWLRTIRHVAGSMVAGSRDRRSSDEKDTSSEKGGRRSSSATDDSQDSAGAVHHGPERIKVRLYGKSYKELSGLFMNQEVRAHYGPIWSIKFSPDGRYLASAGEDCVIHVWEVLEFERRREENGVSNPFVAVMCNGSPEPTLALATVDGSHWDKKLRARVSQCRKSSSSDRLMVPEHVFGLSEKPVKTFEGHSMDVLDLCWSKSQYLLSSSMDKTVKLWDMSSVSCLKTFSHCDYVTCIQFNPVDDRYFISGSLDEKVRIWSIPKREIVDWHDLHEMVTAACYTPDGQSALVGSHKGSCHLYDTSDNKLIQQRQIDLQTKKKSRQKKITGFQLLEQFLPGSSSKVLITSADSRIRVIDDFELVHKFKGFRNTNSQISACYAARGRYVISASENSHVYMWRNDDGPEQRSGSSKGVVSVANSYEYFYCQDVTVAAALPSTAGSAATSRTNSRRKHQELDCVSEYPDGDSSDFQQQQQSHNDLSDGSNHSGDRASATWPEELMTPTKQSLRSSTSLPDGDAAGQAPSRSAWGMAIATAGSGGQIRILQNFGFPVRV